MKKSRFIKYTASAILTLAATAAILLLSSCSHSHHFGEFTVLSTPTCTKTGLQEAVCDCGVIREDEIPVTDHVPGSWEVITPATCVANGTMQQHCKTCGILVDSKTVPALGHDIIKMEAKAPTCSEQGYTEHELCTRCGYSNKTSIVTLPHTPGAEADCVHAQICTVCEAVLTEAKGHKRSVIPGVPATCTKEGISDFVECLTCHQVIEEQIVIPERAHTLVDVPETPATCSKKGLSAGKQCTVCGFEYVKQVTTPKAAHKFSDDTDSTCDVCGKVRVLGCAHPDDMLDISGSVTATCRTYGITSSARCKKCNEIIREAEVTSAKMHNVETVSGYPATLTKPGLTDGRRCSMCLTVLVEQEVIPVGDMRSPVISISDEDILSGSTPESVLIDYNKKISEAMAASSYKVTDKTTETVTYSYGGTNTSSSTDVIIYNGGNWSTSMTENGIKMNMIFADGVLYLEYTSGGEKVKNKCPYLTEEEIRSLLGMDFTNSGLMAYKKVTFAEDGGKTTFNCSGVDTEVDSLLTDLLETLEALGTVEFKNDKMTMVMTVDENYRVVSQSISTTVSVEMPFIGGTQNTTSATYTYEYGDYKVTAPADADSYTQKNSLAELLG